MGAALLLALAFAVAMIRPTLRAMERESIRREEARLRSWSRERRSGRKVADEGEDG